MQHLSAQVTSSLLQFPEVTTQALGEDEITLGSVLRGKFSGGRSGLAWLACGPQLEVVNYVTGERRSAYRFRGVKKKPPTIRVVKDFSWQKRTGLLVGLEEAEGSVLCLYDLGISRVVKAVVLPGRVTAIEPITNHGGPSVSTRHLHQSLRWFFGVAAVATDVGHLLLVDLCLDFSCNQNETQASGLEVATRIPAEVPQRREAVTREGRHLCFQLQNPSGTAISTLYYISRSNQLVVGFSDGCLSLWNMKTLKREHHSQLEGGRIPVYAVTFQEPENDPRHCCYLWAVQSTQESEGDVVSLRLLQLAFGDRKRLAPGQVMYEGLEYCVERYSLGLTGGVFPLSGRASDIKLLSCQTVEKLPKCVDGEDSVNAVVSPDTSVSVFSWQVNTCGQGKPSAYLGVFDINCWYHAHMPDSLRPEELLHHCPYFALWSLDTVISMTSPNPLLDILVHERSLSRGVPLSHPLPEQFFHPSSYNFGGTCLLNSGVVHMTCIGFQKEALNFLKKCGPLRSEAIHDSYKRCLVAGLLPPRRVDVQPSSLSQEEQLEAVLSAAVQTGSLELLTGCIKHWASEAQPSSAANLRFVLEWTWNKVIYAKDEFDQICVPLFDGSRNFVDPQTLQSLQHCQLLLSNLSVVLTRFLTEAQELTGKGFTDLTNKQVVTGLLSLYARVVIWFCRSSLLPEGLDDDARLGRPFYNYPLIQSYYTGHRQKLERLSRGKWDSDCLMIDGMVSQLGDQVEKLWRRDEGGTGKYPPASLHALLDLYLLEGIEESYKHAITIYLLLDITHSFPNKTETSIDSFPTAFAIPWGLVKLVEGFWLLDHNDYENSLALLFHPATIKTVSWQHRRIIQSLMCQGEHRRALRYLQMMKPAMPSSSEVRLFLAVLLSNRCVVEAWGLLQQHATRLNIEELLKHVYEICQEMGLMEDLLKLPFTGTEQECLEKILQSDAAVRNPRFPLDHHVQRANYIPALQSNRSMNVNLTNDGEPRLRERAVARSSRLDQCGKILPRVQRKLARERAKPYHLPSSVSREVARPKPLSTVTKQANAGNVRTSATFISNILSKSDEVGVGNEQKTSCSRRDRSLDLVVRPVPSSSAAQGDSWQSPCSASTSFMAPSPLKPNMLGSISQKNFSGASELNLLETPLVVKNDGEPRLRERAVARSSRLDQCGKILPRVQRKLARERAKPYHLPSSVSREVARPKPLSTVTKQANAGNVRTSATFISNILSKSDEVGVGNEQKTSCSRRDRSLDLVVRPVPSSSAAQGDSWQSPCSASTSFMAPSPLKPNMLGSISQKNFSGASELNLLETPLVVKNDGEPRLRERAVARSSRLDQCGKILPRVQRKLARERAKPYHLPSSVSREVARPKPLSTVTKQANAGNVHTSATFISNILSKSGEVGVGNEQKTSCSRRDRSLDLVVRPVPSSSAAQGDSWQSPCSASTSFMAPSPLKPNMLGSISQKNFSGASELNLLETPLVVKNDGEPRLRERAVARSSRLDQCGKILPRVQRKLARERAKPYHLPSSVSREVARPKPLSTVTKQANAGNVHTSATFISNILSKSGEVGVGNEQKTSCSRRDRSLDLVVRPVPSSSAAQGDSWQSPCSASTSFMAPSPLKPNMLGSISQKNFSGASELNLLETPLVVKGAKVLATAASGFPAFTPQSMLRSSLHTTPLATPSASPGQSVTPPLQAKEHRISFREENLNAKWTVGVTEDNKAPSGVSSEHHHGVVEESRDEPTLFPLSNPEEDGAEVEESGDGLEKMDVSKEKSNFSARSDQAALEYHDAKSPGDFEDEVIFIAVNPANSSTEETADFEELEKEEDSEIVEEKPFPMEQPDSSELRKAAGFVEESNAERLTLPEDGKWLFQAAEAATSGTASEGEANQQESKMSSSSAEKAIPVATNPQLSESLQAEGESVIRTLDSEDVVSTHSENCLEGKCVDLPEERNPEAAEDEGNVPLPQEEVTVCNNLPKTEEINVIEDGAVKAQTSEAAPETSPYSEIHPSGNLQYSHDTTEQQLACHLPDNRDGECDAAEGDGELFLSQSNSTLVLEGEEGEAEMGDPTLVDASKAAGTTTEEKPVNSLGNTETQEHVTNSVSTVTSYQASQNMAESLPYVPEPIKAAIAENLLDAIKDTRSKEFTSEVVEQSIHETTGKKVTGFQKAKAPLRTVPEGVEDETSVRQVEHGIAPRTRTRGQLSRSLSAPSAGTQQLLKTGKPGLFALSPRRNTRQTKEAPETSSLQTEENAQEEQMLVIPVTPRKGRKPKPSSAEKVESSLSDGRTLSLPTQSVAATPRRRLRRAKEAAAELLGEANEETSLAEGSIIASATSQRTRGGKSSAGGQDTGQIDTGHKIKTSVSPSRSTRKLKSVNLQFMQNIVKDQEVQPSAQHLLPVPAKRGRRRKMSSSEDSENSDLDLSKSSLPQTEFKLPVTPGRRARKQAQNLLADTESPSAQEDMCAGGKVGILDTPERRIRGVPHAKLEKTDAPEQRAAQPNEESSTPRTTVGTGRRGRKRRLVLEESTGEEAFPQGPAGSPLMLEERNPSKCAAIIRSVMDRITRTCLVCK